MLSIRKDKLQHFIVGLGIASLSLTFGFNQIIAFVLVSIFGIGKEVYDYFHPKKHTADLFDAFATILGGGLAIYLNLL